MPFISIGFYRLNFRTFDVESSAGCDKDYLLANGNKLCGTNVGNTLYPVPQGTRETELVFVTDSFGRYQGPYS